MIRERAGIIIAHVRMRFCIFAGRKEDQKKASDLDMMPQQQPGDVEFFSPEAFQVSEVVKYANSVAPFVTSDQCSDT